MPRRTLIPRYLLGKALRRLGGPFRAWYEEYTLVDSDIRTPTSVEAAPGAFLMIRTEAMRALNGFDPHFFLYHENSDLSRRALRLGNIVYHPQFLITHDWQRSSAKDPKCAWHHLCSTFKYFKKWGWQW